MTSSPEPKRVLFIGQQPEIVDFSAPAFPPGFDTAKIHAGIAIGMQQIAAYLTWTVSSPIWVDREGH